MIKQQDIFEKLGELQTEIRSNHTETVTRLHSVDDHLQRLNGQVEKNTKFRLERSGATKVAIWVLAIVFFPLTWIAIKLHFG